MTFMSPGLSKNVHVIILQRQIVQLLTGDRMRTFVAYVTSLREVKNKTKLQTISSKSGRGRLREVPTIVIWQAKFWYFGKVVAQERWSLTRGGRKGRFVCDNYWCFVIFASAWLPPIFFVLFGFQ